MRTHPASICVLLAFGAACGSRSVGTITVAVIATTPADGAVDVEPDATVEVQFAAPQPTLPPGTIAVGDGSGAFRGTATPVGDGSAWRWTKDAAYGGPELPRGARIVLRVTTSSGTTAAAFHVREPAVAHIHELPPSPSRVHTWSNGRRVVTSGIRTFEVGANGQDLTERFIAVPDDATTFGDGGFLHGASDPLVGEVLVRANLDGSRQSVPMPITTVTFLPVANRHGDAAVLVTASHAPFTIATRGVWRLRRDATTWDLAMPLPEPAYAGVPNLPSIDDDGGVYLAHVVAGGPRVLHTGPGSTAAHLHFPPAAAPVTTFAFGVGGDGIDVAAWLEGPKLRIARFECVTGFTPLVSIPVDLAGSTSQVVALQTSRSGSTLLVVAGFGAVPYPPGPSTGVPVLFRRLLRVERSGWIGEAQGSASAPYPPTAPSLERLELWHLAVNANTVVVRQNRPGTELGPELSIYEPQQPGNSVTYRHLGVDDQGRALLVVADGPPATPSTTFRLVALQ